MSSADIAKISTLQTYMDLPCVTKLPKFLPTMQCHVLPAFPSSNYVGRSALQTPAARHYIPRPSPRTFSFMNFAISFSIVNSSIALDAAHWLIPCFHRDKAMIGASHTDFDGFLLHFFALAMPCKYHVGRIWASSSVPYPNF